MSGRGVPAETEGDRRSPRVWALGFTLGDSGAGLKRPDAVMRDVSAVACGLFGLVLGEMRRARILLLAATCGPMP